MSETEGPWSRRAFDPELEADLAAERSIPAGSDEAKARILAAVQTSVAAPPQVAGGAGGAGGAVGGVVSKGLAAVALLAGIAGVGIWSRTSDGGVTPPSVAVAAPVSVAVAAPVSVAVAAPVSVAVAAPVSVAVAAPVSVAVAAPVSVAAVPAPVSVAPRPRHVAPKPVADEPPHPQVVAEPRASTLGEEQALLESARRALAGGDVTGALAAINTHANRFATGGLSEERDVLRIQAFARGGRLDEARSLASRFRERYPRSLLRAAVDYATGAAE